MGFWCVGVLMGIAAVRAGLLLTGFEFLLIGLVLILLAFKRSRLGLFVLLLSGLLMGNWQGSKAELELRALDSYIGQRVILTGTIIDDPTYSHRSDRQFHLTNITLDGREVSGKIRASTFAPLTPKRGDRITLKGKLTAGYGNYQAKLGFAEVVALSPGNEAILQVRDTFAAGVRNAIPEPQASLGLGFLLGQRSALPDSLDEDMRRVGLTHIVVASGYNLTILVRAARRLLARFSKFQAFAGSFGLMMAFVAVTGFSPSMTRAALVTTLSLLAWYYGRRIHPLLLILFAAAVTAILNPVFLWSDLGWYLSFLAFAGVLLLAPLIIARLYRDGQPSLLHQVAIESLAAQIMVTPLILWIFGEFAVLALIANVLVVPLIPIAMLFSFIAGIAGMIIPSTAGWAGFPATVLMHYMTTTTRWLSELQWAMIEVKFELLLMVALYLAILAFGVGLFYRTKYNFLKSSITD